MELGRKNSLEARAKEKARLDAIKVEFPVKDLKAARSEECLKYCLSELSTGTTYNELRMKLGLGPAHLDKRWREIRSLLSELILPENEEEMLKAQSALSGFMLGRVEEFYVELEKRMALSPPGKDKMEFQYWKLKLDAMKLMMEKYDKQSEHYLKMKHMQKMEKRKTGQTIIFNNKFMVPRPGDSIDVTPMSDVAKLKSRLNEIEEMDE